jgi:uncharacterized membrane protein (DUF4010 family)
MQLPLYGQLAVALGLGLLVGFQRERAGSKLAGIRTFALITLLGAVAALLARAHGGWLIGAGWLGLAAITVTSMVAKWKAGDVDPGATTEAAVLLMYGVGALVVTGPVEMALALGGLVAVLLHLKEPLHEWVARIGASDTAAIMRFVLVTLVVLPVLPDVPLGPYGVLSPFHVWLMAVLIIGIELGGYVAYKLTGAQGGTVLAGVLGGLISSTATTVGYARRAARQPESAPAVSAVIAIAGTVVFARLVALVAAVEPEALRTIAPPVLAVGAVAGLVAALAVWRGARDDAHELPPQVNPAELRPALVFAAVYAAVLVATAFARDRVGEQGLFAVSILSGVADVDAITLSSLRLVESGGVGADPAWRMILAAAVANLLFKAGIVGALGPRQLIGRVVLLFAPPIAVAIAVIAFAP